MLIDSHVHLDTPPFDPDRDEVIARARASGVELMLEIAGSDIARGSLPIGLALAETYPFIYAAIGVHPHEASLYDERLEGEMVAASERAKVIAWGEIGLDYHYDHSPRETQRRVFRRQLALARERRLPAIIHTREAEDDTIAILEDESDGAPGILHCFTGTPRLAEKALALGFLISFSGVITFRNAEPLREVARIVPDDRILIETDCPYLAPVPHRGRRNEPAFIVETARALALLRGASEAAVARVTSANFLRLFGLPRQTTIN